MNSFPWTSTADGLDEDGFPNYDRASTAEDLQDLFSRFFSTGVAMDVGSGLQVVVGSSMNVTVKPGWCCVNGTFGVETEDRTIALQGSDPTYDRIDTIVARWNRNVDARYIELYAVKGTPAQTPTRPTLTRNESVYEIGLADVFVSAGSGAVTQQRITDTRLETGRCGAMAPFETIDTTSLFEQLKSQVDENIELIQSAIDGTTASILEEKIESVRKNSAGISNDTTSGYIWSDDTNDQVVCVLSDGAVGKFSIIGYKDRLSMYDFGESKTLWTLKPSSPLDAYPVGAVYISYVSTSPASIFGGKWTAITGHFPYFNAGTGTGGSNTHTHGLGAGYAQFSDSNYGDGNAAIVAGRKAASWSNGSGMLMQWVGGQFSRFNHGSLSDQSVATPLGGSTDSGNNMPAYQTLYAWRRTA